MFSLELEFHDGVSPVEVIFVRRAFATIGSSSNSHVVIEGVNEEVPELRITRGLGRTFSCELIPVDGSSLGKSTYTSETEVDLGGVSARFISLDIDLQVLANESPDQAGVRVLRKALTEESPTFPAVAALGANPVFTSFPRNDGLLIGRSRSCGLRLDTPDVSAEHARIGLENGVFWVEDVGSSNGTFIGHHGGERVSGRRTLRRDEKVCIGSEIVLACFLSEHDIVGVEVKGYAEKPVSPATKSYPCVISESDSVRPNRFTFEKNNHALVGRDPASDIWIAASHISRTQAEVALRPDGKIDVTDMSSNGTFLNTTRLPRGIPVTLPEGVSVIDLNNGLTLGVCFSKDDEVRFLEGNLVDAKTALVQQAVIDEAKSQRLPGDRVLTPLEQAQLDRQRSEVETKNFERPSRYPWNQDAEGAGARSSVVETAVVAALPAIQETKPDGSGFQRLIARDSWGTTPRGASKKFSDSGGRTMESEDETSPRAEESGNEPLLLYDGVSTGLPSWVFVLCAVFLVAIIVAVLLVDFG